MVREWLSSTTMRIQTPWRSRLASSLTLDSEHRIVGIDIEDASKVVDLSCLGSRGVAHSLTYGASVLLLQPREPGLKRPVFAPCEPRYTDADEPELTPRPKLPPQQ